MRLTATITMFSIVIAGSFQFVAGGRIGDGDCEEQEREADHQ
jgi:hypothetical protein